MLAILAACNQASPDDPPGLGEPPPGLGEALPVIYVNVDAVGSGNGSSWANAYTDLQKALNQTSKGQLWVAQGSYDLSDSLVLKSGVAVYGGFAGNETSRDARDWDDNTTTIDGGDADFPVVTSENVDATAMLDGFTIQNGAGGLSNRGGSPALGNLIFSNNDATNGGGMYNKGGNPALTKVTFTENNAQSGGGFYNAEGSPTLTNVSFGSKALGLDGNKASANGGGMYVASGNPSLTKVTFYSNTATSLGGGLYIAGRVDAGGPTLNGVSFDTNTGRKGGGGLYISIGSLTMTSGSFSNNSVTTGSSGGGLYNDSGSISLQDTTFGSNKAQVNGGGLYNQSGSVSLSESFQFQNNFAANAGGGLYSAGGSLTLNTGGFSTNKATGQGGGLYAAASKAVKITITNVNVAQNEASTDSGGGIYLDGGGALTLNAVKFGGNTAGLSGGGLYASGDGTITLAAVSFTNNTATKGGGGGMYNSGNTLLTQGSTKSTFTTNKASGSGGPPLAGVGGGLYHTRANANLSNVSFTSNQVENPFGQSLGGGMFALTSDLLTLENVSFSTNQTDERGWGGGLYASVESIHFNRGTFSGNQANFAGGMGLKCSWDDGDDPPLLTNLVFSSNTVNDGPQGRQAQVGALYVGCSQAQLSNMTFVGNHSQSTFGGLSLDPPDGDPKLYTVANSIFWNNTDRSGLDAVSQVHLGSCPAVFKNNLIQGGLDLTQQDCSDATVQNVITTDPLFSSPQNLQLQAASPAINSGNNNFVPNGVRTDLAGSPRIFNNIVDLGAYEFQGAPTLAPPTTSPTIDPRRYAQCAGNTGKWASGYQVRYAASFVGIDGRETAKGPWTPWTNGSPYMLPNLQDVPIDPSRRAAARSVYRQFQADYVASNPSAGVTLTGTLHDNTTTELQDEDTAGTPVVPCPT